MKFIRLLSDYDFARRCYVDGLYFDKGRWRSTAEDATSQTNYGVREAEYRFDTLHSDSDCEKRAETLLYPLKDPPIRLDVATPWKHKH